MMPNMKGKKQHSQDITHVTSIYSCVWGRRVRGESETGEEGERRGRKGVLNDQGDTFGQGCVVCSLWRSLLQISFMVLLHGIFL